MKYIMITIVLVGMVASTVAQAPKAASEKPDLGVSFAKTALRALLAIADFKGTGSLTGPAKNAYEDARAKANSSNAPETLMTANLLEFAILRSTNNLARASIILKLEKAQKDPELSAALTSIDKRESECLRALEKALQNRTAIPLPGMCSK